MHAATVATSLGAQASADASAADQLDEMVLEREDVYDDAYNARRLESREGYEADRAVPAADTLLAEMREESAPVRAPEPEKARGGSGGESISAVALIPPARNGSGE